MILIDSISMKEIRGIRDLALTFDGKSYVVCGPNGTGKSGVVDAIEFCLTGDISRLTGRGTQGVTLLKHGPHVKRKNDPERSEVTIALRIPSIGKSAVVTRNMKKPNELRIEPEDADIRAVMDEVESHPELVLSRREIIKFVLAEAGERSKEVQALLRLDRIEQIRSVLVTANNKVKAASSQAKDATKRSEGALSRHLGIADSSPEAMLEAVNARRGVLGLGVISAFDAATKFNEGVEASAKAASFNKESALQEVDALLFALGDGSKDGAAAVEAIGEDIKAFEEEPELLSLVQREAFVQTGLGLVDSALCPLCDTEWPDVEELKGHIEEKLAESSAAAKIGKRIIANGKIAIKTLGELEALSTTIGKLAKEESKDSLAESLDNWSESLDEFKKELSTVERIIASKDKLAGGWMRVPSSVGEGLVSFRGHLDAKPDQTAKVDAQTYLNRAQDLLDEVRTALRWYERARLGAEASQKVCDLYVEVSAKALSEMYESVESDFSEFYRAINSGDEERFKAHLEQASGKLDLTVEFYGLGMYPPSAYHSEGHQDGMGVCLYLALMKHLFGDDFSFAVLDDVVMSIDSGHRREFCRLLREKFPNTQFVITTHDPIWASQLETERVISSRARAEFLGWDVEAGPIFQASSEVWDRIEDDLAKNDVPGAAHKLRRHLEAQCKELANALGARMPFRSDANYDLGDLFSGVVGRQTELFKAASSAANSWNDQSEVDEIVRLREARTEALDEYSGEQWIINKAVHFNDWATFSVEDFRPVVSATRAFLKQFRCKNPECGSWVHPVPLREPEAFRCDCGEVDLKLKKKPSETRGA